MKISQLLRQGKTIFSIDDLAVIWQISERRKLVEIIKYYLRTGQLVSVRRGVYALDEKYSPLEAAQKIFPPCYISCHTALALHGINFQYYETIHCMAAKGKIVTLPEQTIVYHQLKDELLFNETGLVWQDNYLLAGPERAIIDALYLHPDSVFDHLASIDSDLLLALAQIYDKQSIIRKVRLLIERINA